LLPSFVPENRNKQQMIKISKSTKLGFVILACLTILIWGINFLKGIDLFKVNSTYYVVYERIDGLLESSSVSINGYQIGQVSKIQLINDNSGKLLVTLSIQGDFKIPKGTSAKIIASDLMGTKSVKLMIEPSKEYYKANDTIPGAIESDLKEQVSMQVLPLKNKAEELIASLDSALTVITSVFNQKTRNNLSQSFENINLTLANIQSASAELNKIVTSGKVNSIVTNLDGITTTINKNSKEISTLIKNISSLSDSLAKQNISPLFVKIDSTIGGLNQIVKKLNSSESSAGQLLNDPTLYQNLNNLTSSLDLLLNDVRNNPKRYVHFSAFNLGKDVYITAKPATPDDKNKIVYKVHLMSSSTKLSTESAIFKNLGKIEELKVNETYIYLAGKTTDFEKISVLLQAARINFPDATLVAFKNGRKIKLEKALQLQLN
jgi:phospholipid/cholesterol/gamma-HCH transport system substrate-binding protein